MGGAQEKRPGNDRPKVKSVGKPRTVNSNRPGKGLIFGPSKGERVLVASGKRLRADTESLVRPGGVFDVGGKICGHGTRNEKGQRGGVHDINSNSVETLVQMEVVTQVAPVIRTPESMNA